MNSESYVQRKKASQSLALVDAALAQPSAPARVLGDAEIEAGWRRVFSTNNPYCPCDLRSFTRAARWAESAILAASTGASDAK